MKRLIFLVFLLISLVSEAQTIKYKITHESYKTYDVFTEKWSRWSDWYEVKDVSLSFDSFDQIINVYSASEEVYQIVEEIGRKQLEGFISITFAGLDKDNIKCHIEFVHYELKGDQIYIRWTNFQLVYQIKKI